MDLMVSLGKTTLARCSRDFNITQYEHNVKAHLYSAVDVKMQLMISRRWRGGRYVVTNMQQ